MLLLQSATDSWQTVITIASGLTAIGALAFLAFRLGKAQGGMLIDPSAWIKWQARADEQLARHEKEIERLRKWRHDRENDELGVRLRKLHHPDHHDEDER